MLLCTTAAWGVSFPAGKALMLTLERQAPGHSTWFWAALLMSARFGMAALALAGAMPRECLRITRAEWWQGALLGVTGGAGMFLQGDALRYTHASTVAFLTQFTCVLVPITIFLRTRIAPSPFKLVCIGLVIVGVAVLARVDWRALELGRGELETLIGTTFFTVQILALESPAFRYNNMRRVSLVMFSVITLLFLPACFGEASCAADLRALISPLPNLAVLLVLGLISSLLAFLLMNEWQPRVDATTAAVIYCTEPLFATVFALWLPAILGRFLGAEYGNEIISAHLLIGGALITIANLAIALQPTARARGETTD